MNSDFAAKFIWACAFLFVYSLPGKIFLFKIVKMDLTNSRQRNSPQLFDQSKHKYISIFALSANGGEWPSGLRRCNQNWKVPGSKPARRSTGFRDPTSLWRSRWPSGWTCTNAVISIGLVRLSPWEWSKVGRETAK